MDNARVEIIAVGREILTGHTLDTNSHWLATRVTALGGQVKRMVAVDDIPEEIVEEVQAALRHQTRLLLTTGGLGPTPDDVTLAGIARALGLPLMLNADACTFVAQCYRELAERGLVESAELTPPRRKMAEMPRGARWFPNQLGTAPAVLIEKDGTTVISLPGVPAEMKAIFADSLVPELPGLLGRRVFLTREVHSGLGDESVITQATEKVMRTIPDVYLKSLPIGFGPDVDILVRLSATGTAEKEVSACLERAEQELRRQLAQVRDSSR